MVKTLSTMLELGTRAPDFSLPDVVSGRAISLASFGDEKAVLVMFICRHCPFVKHVQDELARLGATTGVGESASSRSARTTRPATRMMLRNA
jgi:peroxiredoxin